MVCRHLRVTRVPPLTFLCPIVRMTPKCRLSSGCLSWQRLWSRSSFWPRSGVWGIFTEFVGQHLSNLAFEIDRGEGLLDERHAGSQHVRLDKLATVAGHVEYFRFRA